MNGTYEEKLSCGGILKVTKNSWEIFYYFSGPDLRYNGEILSVAGSKVEAYISAFNENWLEYQKLKPNFPNDCEFSKIGKMEMTIRIGRFNEGVCIKSYHLPIKSKQQLDDVISDYRFSLQRAPKIQELLRSL